MDLGIGAHVPDAGRGVAAGGDEDVERGVEGECLHAGEMSVVVADNCVCFQVPAAHHLWKYSHKRGW